MTRETQEVLDSLQECDEYVKNVEDQHLSGWRRLRRRYMTGNSFLAWNLSSVVTYLQCIAGAALTFGPKATWAFMCIKLPWLTTSLTKIGTAISTAVAAFVSIVS